jgi:hypothetical protein
MVLHAGGEAEAGVFQVQEQSKQAESPYLKKPEFKPQYCQNKIKVLKYKDC